MGRTMSVVRVFCEKVRLLNVLVCAHMSASARAVRSKPWPDCQEVPRPRSDAASYERKKVRKQLSGVQFAWDSRGFRQRHARCSAAENTVRKASQLLSACMCTIAIFPKIVNMVTFNLLSFFSFMGKKKTSGREVDVPKWQPACLFLVFCERKCAGFRVRGCAVPRCNGRLTRGFVARCAVLRHGRITICGTRPRADAVADQMANSLTIRQPSGRTRSYVAWSYVRSTVLHRTEARILFSAMPL